MSHSRWPGGRRGVESAARPRAAAPASIGGASVGAAAAPRSAAARSPLALSPAARLPARRRLDLAPERFALLTRKPCHARRQAGTREDVFAEAFFAAPFVTARFVADEAAFFPAPADAVLLAPVAPVAFL